MQTTLQHRLLALLALSLLATLLASCAPPTEAAPVTQGISGTVVDAETGNPVADAVVETDPPSSTVKSDPAGAFEVTDIAVGHYTIRVRAVGYDIFETQVWVREGLPTRSDMLLVRHVATPALTDSSSAPYFPSAPAFSSTSSASSSLCNCSSSTPASSVSSSAGSSVAMSSVVPTSSCLTQCSSSRASSSSVVRTARWKLLPQLGSATLNEVSAVAGGYAWAISDNDLYRCGPTQCTRDASIPVLYSTNYIYGVALKSPSHGYILLTGPGYVPLTVLRWDSVGWTIMDIPGTDNWSCRDHNTLSVLNDSDIFVACNNKAIHFDGATWTQFSLPTTVHRIRQLPDGRAFALIGDTRFCEYDGGLWDCTVGRIEASSSSWWDFVVSDDGTQFWAASYSELYVGTLAGMVKQRDLSGNFYGGYSIAVAGGVGFAPRSSGQVLQLSATGTWPQVSTPTTSTLYSVGLVTADDGWMVGDNGTVMRWTK